MDERMKVVAKALTGAYLSVRTNATVERDAEVVLAALDAYQREHPSYVVTERDEKGRPKRMIVASPVEDSHWATVVIEPENFEPREATDAELELLSDTGISVERMWIQPGAHAESTEQSDELSEAGRHFEAMRLGYEARIQNLVEELRIARCPRCEGTEWLCAHTKGPAAQEGEDRVCCGSPGFCMSADGCPDCASPRPSQSMNA